MRVHTHSFFTRGQYSNVYSLALAPQPNPTQPHPLSEPLHTTFDAHTSRCTFVSYLELGQPGGVLVVGMGQWWTCHNCPSASAQLCPRIAQYAQLCRRGKTKFMLFMQPYGPAVRSGESLGRPCVGMCISDVVGLCFWLLPIRGLGAMVLEEYHCASVLALLVGCRIWRLRRGWDRQFVRGCLRAAHTAGQQHFCLRWWPRALHFSFVQRKCWKGYVMDVPFRPAQ